MLVVAVGKPFGRGWPSLSVSTAWAHREERAQSGRYPSLSGLGRWAGWCPPGEPDLELPVDKAFLCLGRVAPGWGHSGGPERLGRGQLQRCWCPGLREAPLASLAPLTDGEGARLFPDDSAALQQQGSDGLEETRAPGRSREHPASAGPSLGPARAPSTPLPRPRLSGSRRGNSPLASPAAASALRAQRALRGAGSPRPDPGLPPPAPRPGIRPPPPAPGPRPQPPAPGTVPVSRVPLTAALLGAPHAQLGRHLGRLPGQRLQLLLVVPHGFAGNGNLDRALPAAVPVHAGAGVKKVSGRRHGSTAGASAPAHFGPAMPPVSSAWRWRPGAGRGGARCTGW